ncbi:MAG: glycoside hydrolase family 127 protein [Clostridia bacterium]|nr:glycoside hydrolase family 127 protein [Clostridia bacterium]
MKKFFLFAAALFILIPVIAGCGTGPEVPDAESGFMEKYFISEQEAGRIKSSSTLYRADLTGYVGKRVSLNQENWLMTAVKDNPYILEAIENRNSGQKHDIVTWYGEFPGAFLYGAAQCYALTRSESLYDEIEKLVSALESLQAENGYLGNYSDSEQFDMKYWDVGAHFFMLQGLVEWYEASGSERALDMADRISSALYRYVCVRRNPVSVGQLMVLAPLCRLQLIRPDGQKLKLINELSRLTDLNCGFYEGGLNGTPYYMLPVHRWENMFDVQGLYWLGMVRDDGNYAESMLNLRNSLLQTDRHMTGGMTTGETAVGTKWAEGSIETCASVLWEDLNATCYAASPDDSRIIDEIELTFYNAILGAQCEDGKTCTYNTPRNGRKVSSSDELSWQATPGSPDFNCCSANYARGIGLLSKWATYTDGRALRINYYGDGEIITSTPGGNIVAVSQQTRYPSDGKVEITLDLVSPEKFTLCLRIPFWADESTVSVNGEVPYSVIAGYAGLTREWKSGDTVVLNIGTCLHFMKGENEKGGKVALYYGPCLIAMDKNINPTFNGIAPALDVESLDYVLVRKNDYMVAMKVSTADGGQIGLVDFASAGRGGAAYASLFPGKNLESLAGSVDWGLRLP